MNLTLDAQSGTEAPGCLAELLRLPASDFEQLDTALLNLRCAQGLPGAESLDVASCLATLNQWATRVRTETQRHLYRFRKTPSEYEHSEGYFRMLMMAVVLAEDFNVRYNPARISSPEIISAGDGFFANPEDVFLHGLLGPRRMGTCSSMPVLYVALGRRLGYPLKLVTTKGHLFVRWESERERFNIETTGRGVNRHDDEHYRHWPFELTESEIQAHDYLTSLSAAEELAIFLGIRGQCLAEAGRTNEAAQSFAQAVRLAPGTLGFRMLMAQMQTGGSDVARLSGVIAPSVPALGRIEQPLPPMRISPPAGPDPNPLLKLR